MLRDSGIWDYLSVFLVMNDFTLFFCHLFFPISFLIKFDALMSPFRYPG